ncbi:purine nucleoside phosphorylase isoform X2 [Chrysoperla carnea]|uniref:purine nucleoside phosphorylase isoform X2 n=1 Tax=Chrysoperla carnea TaxID=189513 RepID=UPI001D095176|nr:purine nucleoside phosphorylase isoform X2 [Chrysoperla carnea]
MAQVHPPKVYMNGNPKKMANGFEMSDIPKSNGHQQNGAAQNVKEDAYRNNVDYDKHTDKNIDKDTVQNGFSQNEYSYETLVTSANYIKSKIPFTPKIGVICGSGLGLVAKVIENSIIIPYSEIPNFPVSTVHGHAGRLIIGYLNGVPVMCMQGRFHYYEGYPLWKCSMPVRVMKLVGIEHLITTNAAGGLNPDYKVGDIMLMKDHINIMGFAGNSPLQGPNDERFGPRFLPMNKAYNSDLIKLGKEVAKELNIADIVKEGVYTCLGGPNFETVAELKMLKLVGVDAVGMSTVSEVITARHCDLTVFAFSLITNICITDYESHEEANHIEVLDAGKEREHILQQYVTRMVEKIGNLKK